MVNATAITSAANATSSAVRMAVDNATAVGKAVSSGVTNAVNSTTPPLPEITPALPSTMGWSGYFQAIGVLFLLLAVLYFGLWALKRFGKLRGFMGGRLAKDMLSIETQFHLAPKKSLVVVRFLDKRLLLGVTDHQINLLSETEADHDPETAFKDLLDQKARGNNTAD